MTEILKKIRLAKLEIGKVAKNATNPHFKKNYADLNALIEAVEPILLDKGLVMLQPISNTKVSTIIFDVESGESIESCIDLPTIADPQKLGSAITYFRRYTLQSLLSLQAEDDDGNKASKSLPIIPNDRFEKALIAIQEGKATKESLTQNFKLTADQLTKLK